jgi:hypothetical protein
VPAHTTQLGCPASAIGQKVYCLKCWLKYDKGLEWFQRGEIMSDLKTNDKRPFELLFGMPSGYVMDFTNNTFCDLFSDYGIDIYSKKYAINGDSKAKRLRAFWLIESNELVLDVLSALIEYKRQITPILIGNELEWMRQCQTVIHRLRDTKPHHPSLESVKDIAEVYNDQYLSKQIGRMKDSIESDPELVIGTAKELVETCCRTILSERSKSINGKHDMPSIVKAALKELPLIPDVIPEHAKGAEVIKRLVSNLASVLHGLVELRNLYGTGHGKVGKTQSLTSRHAKLAMGTATTLVIFLFETHKDTEKESD